MTTNTVWVYDLSAKTFTSHSKMHFAIFYNWGDIYCKCTIAFPLFARRFLSLQVRSKKVVCISHKQSGYSLTRCIFFHKVHILSQGAYSLTRCIFVRIDNAQCRMATAQAVIVCPFLRSSLLWTWFAVCTLHTPFIRLSAKTAGHACTASQTFKPYF